EREPTPHIYVPFDQTPFQTMSLVARTDRDPAALASSLRAAVWSVDKDVSVDDVRPLEAYIGDAVARPRFAVLLLGAFAAVALGLAVAGLFGVVSYSVGRRTHEIGVRMALGARPSDALRLVLGEGLALVAAGGAAGLVAAAAASRLLSAVLFEVSP